MNCSKSQDDYASYCPFRMSDGRQFTDYRPRCIANHKGSIDPTGKQVNSLNSYEYRQYMISNGEDIMMNNRMSAYNNNKCGPCIEPFNEGTMLSEQNKVVCNKNSCSSYVANPDGLGTGRQYESIDTNQNVEEYSIERQFATLKMSEQMLLSKESCVAPEDTLYFSYDKNDVASSCECRTFNPSGGAPICL